MENTLENKAKLFAQYWGQKVLTLDMNNFYPNQKPWIDFVYDENYNRPSFLQLKPLSSITDEDAIEVAYLHWPYYRDTKHNVDVKWLKNVLETISQHSVVCDYLRSKGYALPYMELSVEKQIEYGWVKLS